VSSVLIDGYSLRYRMQIILYNIQNAVIYSIFIPFELNHLISSASKVHLYIDLFPATFPEVGYHYKYIQF